MWERNFRVCGAPVEWFAVDAMLRVGARIGVILLNGVHRHRVGYATNDASEKPPDHANKQARGTIGRSVSTLSVALRVYMTLVGQFLVGCVGTSVRASLTS